MQGCQQRSGGRRRHAHPNQKPNQCSFDHGTDRGLLDGHEPSTGSLVVLVIGHREGDHHVGVEQQRRHSSSKAAATSVLVTGALMLITGRPERESRE